MHPLMLCIHMDKERLLRLSFAAMSLGVRVKAVAPEQEGQTLAALCGLEAPAESAPAARVEEEMLVFAFLPDALLERLLPALRSGMPPVRLKAVLTENNRGWNCARLYRELSGEAAALSRGGKP